jgi:hypothetical protein
MSLYIQTYHILYIITLIISISNLLGSSSCSHSLSVFSASPATPAFHCFSNIISMIYYSPHCYCSSQ